MSAARPMLAGRVLNRKFLTTLAKKSKKNHHKPNARLRFFLPFMWETCVGVLVGAIIVTGGAAMVTVGYYADHFSTYNTTNGTDIISSYRDRHKAYHLSNLTFVGPVFMGIGCFVIVVAIVVVLETRDKMIRDILSDKKTTGPKKTDFYDVIIDQMKPVDEEHKSVANGVVNKGFQPEDEMGAFKEIPRKGQRRKYSTIEPALRRIPMEIFAINMDNRPGQSSMLEVQLNPLPTRSHSLAALRDFDRSRRPTLSSVFQMESTPDPERRVINHNKHTDPHIVIAERETRFGRCPPPPSEISCASELPSPGRLGSLASHFDLPPPVSPLYTTKPRSTTASTSTVNTSPDPSSGDLYMLPSQSKPTESVTTMVTPAVTSVQQQAQQQQGQAIFTQTVGSKRSSVVVMIHEASLSLGDEVSDNDAVSDASSLSSSREEQLVSCTFGSDSSPMPSPSELTPRPARKDKRRVVRGARRRKSTMLMNAAAESHATLSAVRATVGGIGNAGGDSSQSDDDSLNLTAEMLQHFEMTPADTPDPSAPATAEISFATFTTANTLDNTRDTLDFSTDGTVEVSFASAANAVDTSGTAHPATTEVPQGSTMNTRRRGVNSNPQRLDV